jgi:RNA polymerase sigma factor (TIGR02999 family)
MRLTIGEPGDLPADFAKALQELPGAPKEGLESLLPLVYEDLRRLARSYLRHERPGHTLQATALVHEACLRLMGQERAHWANSSQLIANLAQMMRRILVNHALARRAAKRDGGHRVDIDSVEPAADTANTLDLAELDLALAELESFDARQARVVELRFFAGLSIEETAALLELSPATIKREWSVARLWLRRRLEQNSPTTQSSSA